MKKNKDKTDKDYFRKFIQETLPSRDMTTLREKYSQNTNFQREIDQLDREMESDLATMTMESEEYLNKKFALLSEEDLIDALCTDSSAPVITSQQKEKAWERIQSKIQDQLATIIQLVHHNEILSTKKMEAMAAGESAQAIPETPLKFPNGGEVVLHLEPDSIKGGYKIFLAASDYETICLIDNIKILYRDGTSSTFDGKTFVEGTCRLSEKQANQMLEVKICFK